VSLGVASGQKHRNRPMRAGIQAKPDNQGEAERRNATLAGKSSVVSRLPTPNQKSADSKGPCKQQVLPRGLQPVLVACGSVRAPKCVEAVRWP